MTASNRAHFSRAEVARILNLPIGSVDELIRTGVLAAEGRSITAEQLETYLRNGFLQLYQAEARALLPAAAVVDAVTAAVTDDVIIERTPMPVRNDYPEEDVAEFEITQSIAEFEADGRPDQADLRLAPRYVPRRQMGGTFRQVRFTILQISTTGLRIRHDETFRPGDVARLTFAVMKPARSFGMQARVVWTTIAQRGEGASFCISGLRVIDGNDQLREAIDLLRASHDLQLEEGPARRRTSATMSGPPPTGLSDDDVAAIIRAVRLFSSDPVEAHRWYTRARFALVDDQVRQAAPAKARDREEIVGIWEFLNRRLDLGKITSVVLWLRQTRSASATV
jgi:hypothetical protein